MSRLSLDKAAGTLRRAAVGVAWRQWNAVFSLAQTERAAHAIVDPEALLLLSLALQDVEPRLARVSRAWARTGARLLSVQRMRNISRMFPETILDDLRAFAQSAVVAGDARWRSVAGGAQAMKTERHEPTATPLLDAPAALLLRLRLGLGVGIKADVLACLIGLGGWSATIPELAHATVYHHRAVRRGVEELATAGLVKLRSTSPASFHVVPEPWQALLNGEGTPPVWRPWTSLFAFVADLHSWLNRERPATEYVLASEARDLVARHGKSLERAAQLRPRHAPEPSVDSTLPDPANARGTAYLEPFARTLTVWAKLLDEVV